MNKIIVSIIIAGIILLVLASFFLINRDDVNDIEEVSRENQNNFSQNEQSGTSQITPIREIKIRGMITSISLEDDAAILEIEEFDGVTRSLRIDDAANILYTDDDAGQNVEPGERIEIPPISYSDIEEGQNISATILQKGEDLSTIQYRSPILIYE